MNIIFTTTFIFTFFAFEGYFVTGQTLYGVVNSYTGSIATTPIEQCPSTTYLINIVTSTNKRMEYPSKFYPNVYSIESQNPTYHTLYDNKSTTQCLGRAHLFRIY